jgi:hypothetical protein
MLDGLSPHKNASEQKVIPLRCTRVYKPLLFWSTR